MPAGNGKSACPRIRRSKKETIALKKLLKAERKAGVPVAELAEKHGISTAYIYMLR
jgi:DNA-binding IscR family transcriptional regulator